MPKLLFVFACILLSHSIAKATKQQNSEAMKTKEIPMKMKSEDKTMEETGGDDQDGPSVDLLAVMTECNDTFRVEMSYLQTLNESGSFPDELEKTPKCFVRCVLEKTAVASEDGMYDPQLTAMLFGWDRFKDRNQGMATSCTLNRGETCKCERAYNYLKCFIEKQVQEFEKSIG